MLSRELYIFILFVSVLAMTTTFSVSSVFRFFRYIYNKRTDGKRKSVFNGIIAEFFVNLRMDNKRQ